MLNVTPREKETADVARLTPLYFNDENNKH
jgi:hypothetical protein